MVTQDGQGHKLWISTSARPFTMEYVCEPKGQNPMAKTIAGGHLDIRSCLLPAQTRRKWLNQTHRREPKGAQAEKGYERKERQHFKAPTAAGTRGCLHSWEKLYFSEKSKVTSDKSPLGLSKVSLKETIVLSSECAWLENRNGSSSFIGKHLIATLHQMYAGFLASEETMPIIIFQIRLKDKGLITVD